jgi:chemotaxis protein MotB
MSEDGGGKGHGHGGAPIIIKKVVHGHGGHHGGAWKVAYADLVTALMALFIVLWILSQPDEVLKSIAGYFRDPIGFQEGGHESIVPGTPRSGEEAEPPKPNAQTSPLTEPEKVRFDAPLRSIRGLFEEKQELTKFRDQVELSVSPEGLCITLLETNEQPLFQVGGTDVNPETRDLLVALAEKINELDNYVTIEGHTDSRPFGAQDSGNWELSALRANSARRILESAGVNAARFYEIRGLADRELYNPVNPQDSRNRRISITLLSNEAYRERRSQVYTTGSIDD